MQITDVTATRVCLGTWRQGRLRSAARPILRDGVTIGSIAVPVLSRAASGSPDRALKDLRDQAVIAIETCACSSKAGAHARALGIVEQQTAAVEVLRRQ